MRRDSRRSHARFHFVTDRAELSEENLVIQFLADTTMSRQSESKFLTRLRQFSNLLFALHLVIVQTKCGHH